MTSISSICVLTVRPLRRVQSPVAGLSVLLALKLVSKAGSSEREYFSKLFRFKFSTIRQSVENKREIIEKD